MIKQVCPQHDESISDEILEHKPTGKIGASETFETFETYPVSDRPGEMAIELHDGTILKGPASDFKSATGEQRAKFFEDSLLRSCEPTQI